MSRDIAIAALLALATARVHAQDGLEAPMEVGRHVEIALIKQCRTAEGVRVSTTWREAAGKRLLTVEDCKQGPTMIQPAEGGRVEGLVTAVDDEWLTLDLGASQPLLRISRVAILRWGPPASSAQTTAPPVSEPTEVEGEPYLMPFGVGAKAEIVLAKPYRTGQGVRVRTTWTEQAGKPLMTLAERGQARTMTQPTEGGRVHGLLTALDDAWLTLNLGRDQPSLRIPRRAKVIVQVVPWVGLWPQDETPPSTGNEIRLLSTELGPSPLTVSLLASDAETLLVKVAGHTEPVRVRRSSVEKIQVFRGRGRAAGEGAVVGGLIIGLIGGLATAGLNADASSADLDFSGFALGFAGTAPLGALVGGLIGSIFTTELWEDLPLSVAIAPQPRGARAALTLRF